MALQVKAVVSDMLDNMTLSQAVTSIDNYNEETKQAIIPELWKQYHERCVQGSK